MDRPQDYETLTILDISCMELTELPFWISECKKLKILNCGYNKLTQIDNLPQTLKELYYNNNKITQLDNLPETVNSLWCTQNPFKYEFDPTLENIKNYNNQNKLPT